jgi:hypothetical protein
MVGRRQARVGIWSWLALAAGLLACQPVPASTVCATSLTLNALFTMAVERDLDLVFVIDDGPAMAGWQTTLATQLPSLMTTAQFAPPGMVTSLHVGVVSSDMGLGTVANVALPGCTSGGDGGNLRSQPEGMCTDTTLDPSVTFISAVGSTDDVSSSDGPTASVATQAFQCIAQLGDGGCGFGQPLAALARALGADGEPPPPLNAGFLRPNASLGIIFISNHDDCSTPADTSLFSLQDPAENDLSDPQGPLTHYRCNHAGHVCRDPNGAQGLMAPPLEQPADAALVDGVPTLPLVDCASNDSGDTLTPVSKFVAEIKSLKADPLQILVSGLVGPIAPYAVQWVPEAGGTTGGELWPRVAPSCGSEAADGSGTFGEPSVRLAEFIEAFSNGVLGSICDSNYAEALSGIHSYLPDDGEPSCLSNNIQTKTDAEGHAYPDCIVTEHLTTADSVQDIVLPACATVGPGSPCWSLGAAGSGGCPTGEGPFTVTNEPVGSDPASYTETVSTSCQLPPPADAGSCPG